MPAQRRLGQVERSKELAHPPLAVDLASLTRFVSLLLPPASVRTEPMCAGLHQDRPVRSRAQWARWWSELGSLWWTRDGVRSSSSAGRQYRRSWTAAATAAAAVAAGQNH